MEKKSRSQDNKAINLKLEHFVVYEKSLGYKFSNTLRTWIHELDKCLQSSYMQFLDPL